MPDKQGRCLKFGDAEGNGSTKSKRCKAPFLVKSENYLIGNPFLLLYTRPKEEIDNAPSAGSHILDSPSGYLVEYRRFYDCSSAFFYSSAYTWLSSYQLSRIEKTGGILPGYGSAPVKFTSGFVHRFVWRRDSNTNRKADTIRISACTASLVQ